MTSARAPSGAAAGHPATRNIPTTPAAAGTPVSGFGGVHLASQSLLPTNPLHVPTPASAAPPSPLPSPTIAGSRLSPRRCVWAGDAVSVPPHPLLLCACSRLFSEVLWRHASPARCIAPAWCLLLRSSSATLLLVRRPLLTRLSDLHLFPWLCVLCALQATTGSEVVSADPPG